mmetsp:Transcript_72244/g.233462  ORF Transcript_72244/g.233462 Transcript_72244/m.233462 type:complete len:393 (+) Transcript_72244:1888-3066(+)
MQKERIWVDASRLRQPAALVATTDGEFTQSPTPHRRTGRALQCVLFAGVRGAYPDSQCIPQPPAIAGHASGAVVEIALYALAPICLIVVVPAIVIAHVLYLNRILLSIVRIRRILESRQISSQADAYAVRAACVPTAHLQVCLPVATNDLSIEVVAGVAPLAVAIVTADLVLTNASRATAVLQLHAIVYVLAPQVFRPLQVLGACHRGRAPASCAVAAGADDREARRASQHVGHSDLRRARPAPAVVVDVMAHRLDAHSAGSAHALVCRCVRPLWRRRGRLGLGLGRALASLALLLGLELGLRLLLVLDLLRVYIFLRKCEANYLSAGWHDIPGCGASSRRRPLGMPATSRQGPPRRRFVKRKTTHADTDQGEPSGHRSPKCGMSSRARKAT